jgi:enoyl-CoA hydratase/carnithine racemase
MTMSDFKPEHFNWRVENGIATITLKNPERKNPITFESYAELGQTFRQLAKADDIKVVIFGSNGGNFCSGGDVHDIIGPLTKLDAKGLLDFTRMTGELIKAMRACPQLIIAAIDGVCVGAGAMIALFADVRLGTPRVKTAFLFVRVGLAGCDMGACAMLPRVIGHGRASEMLYTGRTMSAEEGERWGFFNRLVASEALDVEAMKLAQELRSGPTLAHAMTKRMLHQEFAMPLDDAIEAEAVAQAECMQTKDFHRAYQAFVEKRKPVFAGD